MFFMYFFFFHLTWESKIFTHFYLWNTNYILIMNNNNHVYVQTINVQTQTIYNHCNYIYYFSFLFIQILRNLLTFQHTATYKQKKHKTMISLFPNSIQQWNQRTVNILIQIWIKKKNKPIDLIVMCGMHYITFLWWTLWN